MTDQENMKAAVPDAAKRYMRYLLIMAGLGGLLYGCLLYTSPSPRD